MVFKKGYKQTKEHKEKARLSRFAKFGDGICVGCKKTFKKYHKNSLTCGDSECIPVQRKYQYKKSVSGDPLERKAVTLFGTIRLGKGKKEKAIKLLKNHIGEPCVYCGIEITIENASVDHKIPRTGSKVHSRRKGKMAFSPDEIKELDKIENLHIVCRPCNSLKGEFTHEQYLRLLSYLDNNQDIKDTLFKRLKTGFLAFGRR